MLRTTTGPSAGEPAGRVTRNACAFATKEPKGELPFHEIARRIARNDVGENVALAVLHSIETDMPAHPAVRV